MEEAVMEDTIIGSNATARQSKGARMDGSATSNHRRVGWGGATTPLLAEGRWNNGLSTVCAAVQGETNLAIEALSLGRMGGGMIQPRGPENV